MNVHEKKVFMSLFWRETKLNTFTTEAVIASVEYATLKKTYYIKNCTTRSLYITSRMCPKFMRQFQFC